MNYTTGNHKSFSCDRKNSHEGHGSGIIHLLLNGTMKTGNSRQVYEKEYFRFAVAYWHTFSNTGADPVGLGTKIFFRG